MKIKLNLIPHYKKEGIEKSRRFRIVLRWEAGLAGILAIFFALLLSMNYILKVNLSAISSGRPSTENSSQYKKIEKYEEEIRKINAQISNIEKIQKSQLHWSNLFLRLSNLAFSGIEINSLATKNFSVFLAGKASARDDLILFKEKLEKENCFSDVNLPLSNLTAKEDVDFQIDFKIKSECIKAN